MGSTIVWSRHAADELWSGAVTPLTFSALTEPMAWHMVESRLTNAGFVELARQPVFRLIEGHVYVNGSLIQEVMREVPSLLLTDGVLGMLPEALRPALRDRRRSLFDPRTVATVMRLSWRERSWTPWSRARLFELEATRVATELRDFRVSSDLGPEEIATSFATLRERLGGYLDVVSWAMIYAYLSFHLFSHLARAWLPSENALSLLGAGSPEIVTFRVHEALSRLASQVRDDPGLRRDFLELPSTAVVQALRRGDLGSFGREFEDLRQTHGHRLLSRDLAYPSWRERPEVMVDMIQRLALSDGETADQRADGLPGRLRAELGGALRGHFFESVLRWSQRHYAIRENMRYYADYFLAGLRDLALAGGVKLEQRGVLRESEDIFYLSVDEMNSGLREGPGNLAELASGRRREYEVYRETDPPGVVPESIGETIQASGRVSNAEENSNQSRFLATPVSPGTVEGSLRVVRSIDELNGLGPGEIIVAKATDPAWTSYLSLAAGLILEVGGLLSHGAIFAREFRIPAVVDLTGATTLFRSGERVRLDGTAGTVERLP